MYLNCHSWFSFKYGIFSVAGLVQWAKSAGIGSLALTDINNTSGLFEFIELAQEEGIKPLIGIDFRNGDEQLFIGLARNMEGLLALNRFLTPYISNKQKLPAEPPELDHVWFIIPWNRGRNRLLKPAEWIGISPAELTQLPLAPLKQLLPRLVILHTISFPDTKGYQAHKLLRAIHHNTLVHKLTKSQLASLQHSPLAPDELRHKYELYPLIVHNTEWLMASCDISYTFHQNKNKKSFLATPDADYLYLARLTFDGVKKRYGNNGDEAYKRAVKELDIIRQLSFCAYFLVAQDLVQYCRHRGFDYVGRGSAANSIIAYCLEITEVDPISLDLYFERFLNLYRSSPPDIDLDFSWKDRDEIISYLFHKYGAEYTSLLANYNTFQDRSTIRELGKVLGYPKAEIDELILTNNFNKDSVTKTIYKYYDYLSNFPNHLSIHAGGVLISELPIHAYTATEIPPKGFPITQFDMHIAEKIGLYKFDILSQRGLGHIKDTVEIIRQNRGETVDIRATKKFMQDPVINAHLKTGKTVGCFYIESPAMRQLIRKLECDNYPTLVAASSIIRPGVSQSGMMREYIYRHHHPKDFQYIHPKMEELMKETFGIMVYQEDVIKVAHYFAGITLAEADVLRKGMSGKARSSKEMRRIADKFFANCAEYNYPEAITKEVWRQIESFSGYSFSKAHSASYAVESYQSLFLKTYYPLEFMVGVINNFGGFYSTELYVHEARISGATIHPPCVNHSHYLTHITGEDIYLGFIHLKDLEQQLAAEIPAERQRHGPYLSLQDFIERLRPSLEQVNILLRINALRFTNLPRKTMMWEAAMLTQHKEVPITTAPTLFYIPTPTFHIPPLELAPDEDAYEQIELLGFPLCSPFSMLQTAFRGDIMAKDMMANSGHTLRMLGYLITTKGIRTKKSEPMAFGTFVDAEGLLFDSVHFAPSYSKYKFKGKGFYLLKGRIMEEYGHYMLDVELMAKLPMRPDPRYES